MQNKQSPSKKNESRKPRESRKDARQNNLLVLIGGLAIVVIVVVIIAIALPRPSAPAGVNPNVNPNAANTTNNTTSVVSNVPIHLPTAATSSVPNVPAVTANEQWTAQRQTIGGVDMVLVPPGCFNMGGQNSQKDALPVAKICFDQGFWIDRTDVTQAQFAQFGGQAAQPSGSKGDNHPVESVSWVEASAYCAKRGARLPTEAEWEYAARGPNDLLYPWGNTFDPVIDANKVVYAVQSPADVGSKPAGVSWVGAMDMSGNVWQWVSSAYKPYPYNPTDGRETTTDANTPHVLRGGAWDSGGYPENITTIWRNYGVPALVSRHIGFRCAKS